MRQWLTGSLLLFYLTAAAQNHDSPEFYLGTKRKKLAVVLQAAEFQSGDTVVDIGAGTGWFDAALAIHADSLTFFLEDIDSASLRDGRFEEACMAFQRVRGTPFSSRFIPMTGTPSSTGMRDSSCQKILLIDTYHHLSDRDAMIGDMRRILKRDGRVVVYETVARRPKQIMKACNTEIYTQDHLLSAFERGGFRLERIYKTVNANNRKVRIFVFTWS